MLDPLGAFGSWFDEAVAAGEPMPEAMALATATPDGRPSVRYVLCRGRSDQGVRFYTNYESRKSDELGANPRAAAVFHWQTLARQVRIEGRVERTSAADSDAYFASRPRGSQLAAWASPQSRPLGYTELEKRYEALASSYGVRPVPRPPHWGGFLLVAERVELWEGRQHRLHQRLLYTRGPDGRWQEEELAP